MHCIQIKPSFIKPGCKEGLWKGLEIQQETESKSFKSISIRYNHCLSVYLDGSTDGGPTPRATLQPNTTCSSTRHHALILYRPDYRMSDPGS